MSDNTAPIHDFFESGGKWQDHPLYTGMVQAYASQFQDDLGGYPIEELDPVTGYSQGMLIGIGLGLSAGFPDLDQLPDDPDDPAGLTDYIAVIIGIVAADVNMAREANLSRESKNGT
jgi:hypothetical protein